MLHRITERQKVERNENVARNDHAKSYATSSSFSSLNFWYSFNFHSSSGRASVSNVCNSFSAYAYSFFSASISLNPSPAGSSYFAFKS